MIEMLDTNIIKVFYTEEIKNNYLYAYCYMNNNQVYTLKVLLPICKNFKENFIRSCYNDYSRNN